MKNIDVISIPVTDQEKAKAFYLKLGFKVLNETEMDNSRMWVQMALPESQTSITLVTWFKKMPAGSLHGLVIRTDSIEEDIEDLRLKGIEISMIEETPWGKFVSLKDPDGNGLSIQQRSA